MIYKTLPTRDIVPVTPRGGVCQACAGHGCGCPALPLAPVYRMSADRRKLPVGIPETGGDES